MCTSMLIIATRQHSIKPTSAEIGELCLSANELQTLVLGNSQRSHVVRKCPVHTFHANNFCIHEADAPLGMHAACILPSHEASIRPYADCIRSSTLCILASTPTMTHCNPMESASRMHAGCIPSYAACILSYAACIPSYAGCRMQCRLHASLVGPQLKVQ